ncbi:MAG: TolC family protein [Deltaproteobacteria bacterium]|nr:TolC family protein [Deltaproteobacteria bacterium]
MIRHSFRILILFFASSTLVASGAQDVRANSCDAIVSAQDILQCALGRHPDVIHAQAETARDTQLVQIARQRPNPELQGRVLGGHNTGAIRWSSETALLHTVEVGGKRRARIGQARALVKQAGIAVKRNQEAVALQTVFALYRLRQIRLELERAEETITTFSKLLAALNARPTRTPEQEVSQSSFRLAREAYTLKQIALIQERAGMMASLEAATGIPGRTIARHLPKPARWPQSPSAMEPAPRSSASLELARSEQQLSAWKVAVAQSNAWPDLKIGPSVDAEAQDSGETRWFGGVTVSVPLPLWNRNRGEKAFAKADQLRARANLEQVLRKNAAERLLQLKRYRAAVQALRASRSIPGLAVEHQHLETYFEKGLVTSALVIEIHNQLYDITSTRHEQELIAVDALWRLYILDGRVLEAKM